MGVRPFSWMLVCLLPAGEGLAQTDARERVVESIVPWLDYNSSWPAVELKNLGNREVAARGGGTRAAAVWLRSWDTADFGT